MGTYSNLIWNPTYYDSAKDANLGFYSEYVGTTGWLVIVETELTARTEENTDTNGAFLSATENGLTYKCSIFPWNRVAGDNTPHSVEENCTNNRVDSILDEVDAMAGPEYPEETTTTTAAPGPAGQWD